MPGESVSTAREVCHTALVVHGKFDSTHVHHFGPKKLDSVTDSPLEFLNVNAESAYVDGDRQRALRLLGWVIADHL